MIQVLNTASPDPIEIGILKEDGKGLILIPVATMEEAMERAYWGTYGLKQRKEDFRWVRLCDCETEHLFNILTYPGSIYLSPDYRAVIMAILEKRLLEEKALPA